MSIANIVISVDPTWKSKKSFKMHLEYMLDVVSFHTDGRKYNLFFLGHDNLIFDLALKDTKCLKLSAITIEKVKRPYMVLLFGENRTLDDVFKNRKVKCYTLVSHGLYDW